MRGPPLLSWACAAVALLLTAGAQQAAGQAANPCTGLAACTAVPAFVAAVTEFRPNLTGPVSTIATTIRFTNRSARALVLGYVDGSGVATDDRGNRYGVRAGAVRGVGTISSNSFDPRFSLEPGASNEGRIEFTLPPGSRILGAGTTWDLEFAVREIDPVGDNQFQLGKQHTLQFTGFRQGWTARSAAPPGRP